MEVDAGSSSPGETETVEDVVDWFLTQSSGSLGICGSVAIPALRSSAQFLAKAQHGMAQHRGTAEVMLSRSRFPAQDPRLKKEKKSTTFINFRREGRLNAIQHMQKWFM